MRTHQEIKDMIAKFREKPVASSVDAIINVLENDLTKDQVTRFYNCLSRPWVKRAALKAREWLNGEIESGDVYC